MWASDITYVATGEGFLYLAMYLDLYTRKLVGFATAEHMRAELIISALDMALGRQGLITEALVSHSDRGSQYASDVYCKKIEEIGITASMSRKGIAMIMHLQRVFFATIKKELIYRSEFATKAEARRAIFEYIEVWYNRQRIHSSIGYMTPVQYEESLTA